jgi:transposase-like protein
MDLEVTPRALRQAWRRVGYYERRRWDTAHVQDLGVRYNKGERLQDLAAEEDCTVQALYIQFVKHNIMEVHKSPWSQRDLTYMAKAWKQGKTSQQLADEYGVTHNAIQCLIKRHRDVFGYRRTRTSWDEEKLSWVRREIQNGTPVSTVANRFGVSVNALSAALFRAGISRQQWRVWQLEHLAKRVRGGEDLRAVAASHDITSRQLKRLFRNNSITYAR